MNFATNIFLGVSLLTASFATALRGNHIQNDKSNNEHSRRHLLQEGTECVTYMRITDFEEGPDEKVWACEFDLEDAKRFGGVRMAEIDGVTMEELNEKNAISGGTILRVGPSSYVETQIRNIPERKGDNIFLRDYFSGAASSDSYIEVAGPPVLHISPEDEIQIEEMDEATDSRHYKHRRRMREKRRRLAQSTGDLETLVIRVVDRDGLAPSNTKQLDDDIFEDGVSLRTQFTACSHNNINIEKANKQGFSTIYEGEEYKGIVDVAIATKASETHTDTMFNTAISTAENNLLGDDEYLQEFFDLVMICQPPGTYMTYGDHKSTTWIAYAYLDHWMSVYNNIWCNSVSAQMHEVGHNLGLLHSGIRGVKEYADKTGMMGYSYNYDDIPSMCFNSAKNYQLGWYSEQMLEVDPLALPGGSQQFTLNGIVDYEDSDGYVTIRLNYEGQNKDGIDYYLGYNRQAGFNHQTQMGGNQVQIVEKVNVDSREDRNGPGQSWLMKSMKAGEEFSWDIGGTTVILKVDSISGKNAEVTLIGGTAPPPTKAPTSLQTAEPTPAPTAAPTNAPTSPMFSPTTKPTTAPSQQPTNKRGPGTRCWKYESPTDEFMVNSTDNAINCTTVASLPFKSRKRLCRKRILEPNGRTQRVKKKCPVTCGAVGIGKCKFLAAN